MPENRFCFKVSKEAELGYDDNFQPCEVYTQMIIGTEKNVPEDLKKTVHKQLINGMASQLGVGPNYLTPISENEYDLNAE